MCWARKGQGALLIRLIFALTAPEDKLTRDSLKFEAHFRRYRRLFPMWADIAPFSYKRSELAIWHLDLGGLGD